MSFFNNQIISNNLNSVNLSGNTIFSGTNNLSNLFMYSGSNYSNTGQTLFTQKLSSNLLLNSISGASPEFVFTQINDVIILSALTIQKFKLNDSFISGNLANRGGDSELFFNINTNEQWIYEFHVYAQPSGGTGGLVVGVSAETNPSITYIGMANNTNRNSYVNYCITATTQSPPTCCTFLDIGAIHIWGSVNCTGSAGPVRLFVYNANTSQSGVTYKESFMYARRVI